MARNTFVPPDLTDLESGIMAVVWDEGEASVREIMDQLNSGRKKARAYTTYMTVIHRLDRKGLLKRRREGKTDHYSATVTREQFQERRVRREVDDLLDKYGEVALSQFAREMSQLDPARRRALQRLARKD
jgi:predicted transcriptional regulator